MQETRSAPSPNLVIGYLSLLIVVICGIAFLTNKLYSAPKWHENQKRVVVDNQSPEHVYAFFLTPSPPLEDWDEGGFVRISDRRRISRPEICLQQVGIFRYPSQEGFTVDPWTRKSLEITPQRYADLLAVTLASDRTARPIEVRKGIHARFTITTDKLKTPNTRNEEYLGAELEFSYWPAVREHAYVVCAVLAAIGLLWLTISKRMGPQGNWGLRALLATSLVAMTTLVVFLSLQVAQAL